MLKQSRLYTFIDNNKHFALYFLEGQKLIHDLVLTHQLKPEGFSYFRSTVLSVQLMLGLLKHNEYFCFYIDSASPYFRLKIEMNTQGLMRGMMYSDDLNASPVGITGQVRLVKFQPNADLPYQSTIDFDGVGIDEIINQVLTRSYQVKSRIFVSGKSDQSFMLHQLPLTAHEEASDLDAAFSSCIDPLNEIMAKGFTAKPSILKAFDEAGFKYLAHKTVEFRCGCSKDQMIDNVRKFVNTSNDNLFPPGQDYVEVICEYCRTAYQITEKDIQRYSSDYH